MAPNRSDDHGPYRYFWAEVVRKECPECGWATAVGFDNEPGVQDRVPTKCVECSAGDIENGLRAEAEARVALEIPDLPEATVEAATAGPETEAEAEAA
jgi:hypothetical protein